MGAIIALMLVWLVVITVDLVKTKQRLENTRLEAKLFAEYLDYVTGLSKKPNWYDAKTGGINADKINEMR